MKNILVVIALASALVPLQLNAQDKPYAAKPASVSSLIQSASYDEPPVRFDFPEIASRQVVNDGRADFEIVYDIPVEDFVKRYTDAYHNKEIALQASERALPNARTRDLYIIGLATNPDGTRQFTLGAEQIPFRINFWVEPDGRRTVVTIRNVVLSILHSGVMPARVGYKPVGADEIPFRYN